MSLEENSEALKSFNCKYVQRIHLQPEKKKVKSIVSLR